MIKIYDHYKTQYSPLNSNNKMVLENKSKS